jgi:hypothetical protein
MPRYILPFSADGKLAATMERLNGVDAPSKQLRSMAEILGALDMAYREHWAAHQAQLDGGALPAPQWQPHRRAALGLELADGPPKTTKGRLGRG